MNRILLVEDDAALGRGITMALTDGQTTLKHCRTLSQARQEFEHGSFDLLILDINLPDGSGTELLREVRLKSSVPVILLTANDLETDIVCGLESGADDYITKPFSLAVLRSRVKVQLRRAGPAHAGAFTQDGFYFDFDSMDFRKNGQSVELSKTEQKLLRVLVSNRGITLSRAELVDRVWTDGAQYVDENALSVTVKRLRGKLEDEPGAPKYLKTVYGLGYVWSAPERGGEAL